MRKSILYLAGLFLSFAAKAQFSVAIVGGLQTTSVSPAFTLLPDTVSKNATNKTGVKVGFIANVPVNEQQTLFFQTGIIYSQRGSKTLQHFDTSNIDLTAKKALFNATTDLNVNYIDAPINLVYKLPLKGKTKFIIGGGVQASLFYNGKTNLTTVKVYQQQSNADISYEYKITDNNDLLVGKGEAQFRTLHFAANAVAGFEFGRVFLTANYSKGLTGFYTANGQSFKFQTIGASLGIFLGNSQVKKEVVVKDMDGDGIPDEKDGCPSLPGSALTNGCPDKDGDGIADKDDQCPNVAGTLQNKGCPILDRDKDGVNDSEDQCPDVVGLKKYHGCPIPDSDNDGVNDEEDQCPTQAGSKENHGCPQITKAEKEKVAQAARQIQFEFAKAELSPSSYKVLDEVVEILKNNPALNIKVEGHTSGPNSENSMKLSQKRADRVRDYFISKTIAPSRIISIGYGSTKPLNPSDGEKENPKDRRVELNLTSNSSPAKL
jgi:outer membrane protein OmpA-like peptidoglycan-associated protein